MAKHIRDMVRVLAVVAAFAAAVAVLTAALLAARHWIWDDPQPDGSGPQQTEVSHGVVVLVHADTVEVTPTPWHLIDVQCYFPHAPEDIDSYCVTFGLDADVPDDVNLYIAPFNQTFNKVGYYGGIQTRIDGHRIRDQRVRRGRGAIFSRWGERAWGAIEQAPGGLVESSGHEGDFVGVRNDFSWSAGSYELCLRKAAVVEGDPLPDEYEPKDIAYGWGRFAHTWVRMELTDAASGDTTFVGALAFPGRTLSMGRLNEIFVEIYGRPSPFSAVDVPQFTVSFENFQVDGEDLPCDHVTDISNTFPTDADTAQIPKLAYASYDAGRGVVEIEVGRFAGEFGKQRTVHLGR